MYGMTCPLCQRKIGQSFDVHETIISKGDVERMSAEARLDINVPENCTILHHAICHKQPQPKSERDACIRHLAELYGEQKLLDFIYMMRDKHDFKGWEDKERLVRNAIHG